MIVVIKKYEQLLEIRNLSKKVLTREGDVRREIPFRFVPEYNGIDSIYKRSR